MSSQEQMIVYLRGLQMEHMMEFSTPMTQWSKMMDKWLHSMDTGIGHLMEPDGQMVRKNGLWRKNTTELMELMLNDVRIFTDDLPSLKDEDNLYFFE